MYWCSLRTENCSHVVYSQSVQAMSTAWAVAPLSHSHSLTVSCSVRWEDCVAYKRLPSAYGMYGLLTVLARTAAPP